MSVPPAFKYDKKQFCFEAGFEVAGGMNDQHCEATEQLLNDLFADYGENMGANAAESYHEFALPKGMKGKQAPKMIKKRLLDAGAIDFEDR